MENDPNNDQALQMFAKPVPNDAEVIDEAAMHRGLEVIFVSSIYIFVACTLKFNLILQHFQLYYASQYYILEE